MLNQGTVLNLNDRLRSICFSGKAICVIAFVLMMFSPEVVSGQAVQLPRTRNFQLNSSFFVPDGGTIYNGGILRGSEGLTSRGTLGGGIPGLGRLFRNQAYGRSTVNGGVSTSVQVFSLQEISEGLLNGTLDSYGRPIPYRSGNFPGSASSSPNTIGQPRTPSYSWAKKYSLENQIANHKRSDRYSRYSGSKEKELSLQKQNQSVSRLRELMSKPSSADHTLPSNDEIRQRAAFIQRYLGRKK